MRGRGLKIHSTYEIIAKAPERDRGVLDGISPKFDQNLKKAKNAQNPAETGDHNPQRPRPYYEGRGRQFGRQFGRDFSKIRPKPGQKNARTSAASARRK